MYEKLNKILQLFADHQEAEEMLKTAKTQEEAVNILGRFGVEITVEEFVQLAKEVTSDELSEEMLLMVAGGGFKEGWNKFWGGVRDFFQGFLDAF